VPQRLDDLGDGPPRDPGREALVVPEGPREQEIEAGGEREGDDRGGDEGGRARSALCYRFDALS